MPRSTPAAECVDAERAGERTSRAFARRRSAVDRGNPEVLAAAGRHELDEGMDELRHGAGDRELVVSRRAPDERVAVVADMDRVAVVAPVRLDELVLPLDVGHVGDEEDAAIGAVVGRTFGEGRPVRHAPPHDALAGRQRIVRCEPAPWVRATDVRAERAPDALGVVAVVERVDPIGIEAQGRLGTVGRQREW